ncbi:hypothetical protein ELH77_19455 [Rhizobium ruizarguesonis]|uniref:phage tail protein n=1 Tax=Rhizobium ruizarguesonis TaxID=2081791 RepID=UPI001031D300|nr:phage tail protein [Rhizobium ruizarguesonis]TAZ20781.1 hypothetical protein ELH77_19455 [Rhizobium ruizarguesonis]
MGKKSKPKIEVTLYYMSEHFGICHGPLDFISEIKIAEKSAWTGMKATQGDIGIHQPELFGGVKKEGGVEGSVYYLPGNYTQTIPEDIAAKHGRTTATMPAYRGIASAFFYWPQNNSGFYWSANSPYLPTVWIKAARASVALSEEFARIWRGAERGTRTVSNVSYGFTDTGSKLWDVYGSFLVHASSDKSHVIIEDLRTGAVRASISLGYTPVWVYIAGSQEQVLVLALDGTMHVYNMFGGSVGSVSTPDPTLAGADTAATLTQAPTEIEVDGVIYLFWMRFDDVVCCQYSGGAWGFNWVGHPWGTFGVVGGVIAASPDHLVIRMPFGGCYYVLWSPIAIDGTFTSIDFAGLLGWNVTTTDAIHSVSYIPDTGTWFFTASGGKEATLNSDCTAVVAQGITGEHAGGYSLAQPVKSRRILDGSTAAAYISSGDAYFVDVTTGDVIQGISFSEFGISTVGETDAAWSEQERAFVVKTYTGVYVLFLPTNAFDSNPAHIIFDSLTNTDWGMGSPTTAIDVDSFHAAAEVLYSEQFGLSMIWTKQSTIESFIGEVLDHIEAVLYVNPRTGLLTLKLIRNDYDPDDLPIFTPDNCVVTNFGRKLWGETINEIVVTFTNPANEEEQTVIAQDLANIEAQGGIVSDGRNYYGVRVRSLAANLAQRDLRAAATPLASCDIEANREAWDLLPGGVLKIHSPDDGVNSIVMRVGRVDYGKPGDAKVRAALVEDIFALPLSDYTIPPDSEWEPVSEEPAPAANTLVFTLPYYMMVNEVDAIVLLTGIEYPETFAGVLAAQTGQDTAEFELYEADGDDIGTKTIVSRDVLAADIAAEVETTLPAFPDRTQGDAPTVGGLMLIEGEDDTETELCLITAGNSTTGYTVTRGVLDTVPRAWPAGTPVWFMDENLENTDDTIRSEAETVDYKVLTRTSLGLLDLGAAPIVSATLSARPHLPSRPADVKVDGDDGFSGGVVDERGVDPIPVTWARRNRLTEDTVLLAWDAGDVTPEDGQTTRIDILDASGTVLTTHDDLPGTSFDVPAASFSGVSTGRIKVSAKRDDLISLQGYEVAVMIDSGYGDGYGYNYGGA